ncbi:hypothetical protein C8R44DRAFT_889552 [Mycena epipterygia]|nr:hypothetical protein C8R44DRAFT_889552 [Mycena epipterygia]
MAPRKPRWDWKARACAEFKHFTVPFAVKEYVQNVVGQPLKELRVREWSDWQREDLRDVPAKERELRKQSLIAAYPGLLTGPDGAAIKRLKAWVPLYILSATIPQSQLRTVFTTTDLQIAIVVWYHTAIEIPALSVYNNHLDAEAKFSSFTVDGASTSRDNEWAVGEKGKGFILATQFLLEWVEQHLALIKSQGRVVPKDVKAAVSFCVGHQIGTLKWKKSRYPDEDDLLQVILDDLTPRTVDEYMEKQAADARYKNGDSDEDEDDHDVESYGYPSAIAETPKLRKASESALKGIFTRRLTQQLDSKGDQHDRRRSLEVVSRDEVSITVIGLKGSFQPEYLFSAIYGIIPPPQAWRVPGSQVEFFLAAPDTTAPDSQKSTRTKFYHHDQYVPYGLHLNTLSIDYHGDLNITSDRVAILRDDKVIAYKIAVSNSADQAFRTIPDLALELALDILSDQHSEGLAHLVRPNDKDGADAYHDAFEAAMRKMHPEIPADALIHPTPDLAQEQLFTELDLTPVEVSSKAWEIMEKSGAYITIEDYARQLLLSAPAVPTSKGLERLRVAISVVAPDVPPDNITVRDYNKRLPMSCGTRCLCWVGPFLHDAARDYDGAQLGTRKLFRAYLLCMHGDANMEDDSMDVGGRDTERRPPKPQGIGDGSKARNHFPRLLNHHSNCRYSVSPVVNRATTPRSTTASTSGVQSGPKSPTVTVSKAANTTSPQRPRTPVRKSTTNTSSVQSARKSPAVAKPAAVQTPQGPRTSAPQSAANTAKRDTVNSAPRAPTAEKAPTAASSSSSEPVHKASHPVLSAADEDTALTAMSTIVANYKVQKAALENAQSVIDGLQHEIDVGKIRRENLETQVDVLKIDCATQQRRIEELIRIGTDKDAEIASLNVTMAELEERIDEANAGIEALFVKSRKRPRIA